MAPPRRTAVASVALALIAAGGSGCGAGRPRGFGEVRFGEDAASAASGLGVRCDTWVRSLVRGAEGQSFELCQAGTFRAYGHEAFLTLVREGAALAAIQVQYDEHVPRAALRAAIAADYHLQSAGGDPVYQTWQSGELVRFADSTLVVAGASFGAAYEAELLRNGLARVADGMRPH